MTPFSPHHFPPNPLTPVLDDVRNPRWYKCKHGGGDFLILVPTEIILIFGKNYFMGNGVRGNS